MALADINDSVVLSDDSNDSKSDGARNRVLNSKRQWLLHRLIM